MVDTKAAVYTEIVILGGGMGGVAAALAAAHAGHQVCMVEPTDWLGGQMTSQGVSALDEHRFIEEFGGTAAYYQLRRGIREYYWNNYKLAEKVTFPEFNPGNGWVSKLCFEPRAGVAVIEEMLRPYVETGRLQIYKRMHPVAAEAEGNRIKSLTCENKADGGRTVFYGEFFLDATELGDLLPLAGVEYVTGAEPFSQTREPHAHYGSGNKELVQSFTYTFAVEWRPGENHVIPKPKGYEEFRDSQPFTFAIAYSPTRTLVYKMFARADGTPGAFWTYRRLIDAANFADEAYPNDIAMINWPGNDYVGGNIIDKSPDEQERLLDEAKRLSLSFLYWLQTEAPRDDGGKGYPELKLRKDIMGTEDGLSMFPYIRESRRIKALKTIVEQDISSKFQVGPRAAFYSDAVGIGLYPIDIHACARTAGEENPQGVGTQAYPFQIPLGALVPRRVENLIAAAKNIGTTHITNGSYRLHPVEWNIGESAGALAAFALAKSVSPQRVYEDPSLLRQLQDILVQRGIPLYWFDDVPLGHPAFQAIQVLAAAGVIKGNNLNLHFLPDEPCPPEEAEGWIKAVGMLGVDVNGMPVDGTRAAVAKRLYDAAFRNPRMVKT